VLWNVFSCARRPDTELHPNRSHFPRTTLGVLVVVFPFSFQKDRPPFRCPYSMGIVCRIIAQRACCPVPVCLTRALLLQPLMWMMDQQHVLPGPCAAHRPIPPDDTRRERLARGRPQLACVPAILRAMHVATCCYLSRSKASMHACAASDPLSLSLTHTPVEYIQLRTMQQLTFHFVL
jgi:hypothetical protein